MSDDFASEIAAGLTKKLPEPRPLDDAINRAPKRRATLTLVEKRLALKNALRYHDSKHHAALAPEFAAELERFGHIYQYRFRPSYPIHARPLSQIPHRSKQAGAIMLMILNNLDPAVAQYPDELITYGGNGAVFQNWAQYRLTMKYLAELDDDQTLALYSGHPHSVFPSHVDAPRAVVTNGILVPNYSGADELEKLYALGVSQYGQMTAGSFMYIGPQGIVHGTAITVLNAGRFSCPDGLAGKLFVTSGLGGMSGAQAKAGKIAGAVTIVAEVNPKAVEKRRSQGWVDEVYPDLDSLLARARTAIEEREPVSLAYGGNIVDLWEKLAASDIEVALGSDQTSLHNPFGGGYCPAGMSLADAETSMNDSPHVFEDAVRSSLRRQVAAIDALAARGMYFFDYGNAFLFEAERAGAGIRNADGRFRYPSYVEDIMGPLCFDYGFGPFRWVCSSCDPADLGVTDRIAASVLEQLLAEAPADIERQLEDNLRWIREAERNNLVVGSQARILYADSEGRIRLAEAFNDAVRRGEVSAPVILGRDHHDVSGTDSPFRETADIRDGSAFTGDMSVQNVIGDSFRGATWVSLHNGGGVGSGKALNGGFGLVLDGSDDAARRARSMLLWDVNNGVVRRAWAGRAGARGTVERLAKREPRFRATLPTIVQQAILTETIKDPEDDV